MIQKDITTALIEAAGEYPVVTIFGKKSVILMISVNNLHF